MEPLIAMSGHPLPKSENTTHTFKAKTRGSLTLMLFGSFYLWNISLNMHMHSIRPIWLLGPFSSIFSLFQFLWDPNITQKEKEKEPLICHMMAFLKLNKKIKHLTLNTLSHECYFFVYLLLFETFFYFGFKHSYSCLFSNEEIILHVGFIHPPLIRNKK